MKKELSIVLSALLLTSVLASCGGTTTTTATSTEAAGDTTAAQTEIATETAAPETTEAVTTVPVETEPPMVEVFTPVVEYTFDDPDNPGWRTNNATKIESVADGVMTVNVTGGDPSIINKGSFEVSDCSAINAIRIRFINTTSDDSIQIFFTTDTTTGFCEDASFRETLDYTDSDAAGDEWNEVVIYTEDCDLWEGTLKSMRIDLSNGDEGQFIVDSITFDAVTYEQAQG